MRPPVLVPPVTSSIGRGRGVVGSCFAKGDFFHKVTEDEDGGKASYASTIESEDSCTRGRRCLSGGGTGGSTLNRFESDQVVDDERGKTEAGRGGDDDANGSKHGLSANRRRVKARFQGKRPFIGRKVFFSTEDNSSRNCRSLEYI